MERIIKALLIILFLTFSVIFNQCASNQNTDIKPASFIEKTPEAIKNIYFKDGEVIQCDIAWEGVESGILCKKSNNILAYSAGDVDLIRTFGETSGKEIAEGYEKRKREIERMSQPRIVTAEQERRMRNKKRGESVHEKYMKESGIGPIKETERKRNLSITKKRAEYYFKKAEKLIMKGGYGPRKQADILRSIGGSYLHCPGSNINKAQEYYKQVEIKASEVNKCTSINRGKIWYNTTCVNGKIKEAKIFKKMGDSYMGCSGQYIKRMETEEMEEKIEKLERDIKFKADW